MSTNKTSSSSAPKSGDTARPRNGNGKQSSSFRMHASSAADRQRMKKWLEYKQRRQDGEGDGSVVSIVTSEDDVPRPMDPDDSAYRPSVRAPSRIGTVRSYRDVLLTPVQTRGRAAAHDVSPPLPDIGVPVEAVQEGQSTPCLTPSPTALEPAAVIKERVRPRKKKTAKSPAIVISSGDEVDIPVDNHDRPRKKKSAKSIAIVMSSGDEQNAPVVDRTSSSKRRRESGTREDHFRRSGEDESPFVSAKHRRHEHRLPSPPPLGSDSDLPEVMDIVRNPADIAKKSASQNDHASRVHRSGRLPLRDGPLKSSTASQALFDDEVEVDDTVDAMVVSEDEVVSNQNEYNFTDPFINDGSVVDYTGDSDDSMHSAYSLKHSNRRRGRWGSTSRFRARRSSLLSQPDGTKKGAVTSVASGDVLEISSGPEYDRHDRLGLRDVKPVVVKMEPSANEAPLRPRPKPRPVGKKAKFVASEGRSKPASQPTPDMVRLSATATGDEGVVSRDSGPTLFPPGKPIATTGRKGKGRAVDEVVSSGVTASVDVNDLDSDDLHSDEVEEIKCAMKESLARSSRRPADDRSPESSSSSAPHPMITPPVSQRISMADLVADATLSAEPSSPSPTSNGTAFLEDLTSHRHCLALPLKCEVWDPELMDPILKAFYKLLCNLRHGTFISWSDMPGRGFVQFSSWGSWCSEMNGHVALDAVNFEQSGSIRNPSRVSPLDVILRAVPQTTNRYTFYCDTKPSTVFVGVSSIFVDSPQIMEPSATGMRQKYIGGRLHGYEYNRLTGFVATASGFSALHAQIARDTLQFSTRPAPTVKNNDDGQDAADIKGKRSLPSGMFKSPSKHASNATRQVGEVVSLAHDAVVPVYDAQSFDSLEFNKVLPRLADCLPLYTGGELPYGSFAMVGYTMTIYKSNKGKWTIGFNLLWAILIGSPED